MKKFLILIAAVLSINVMLPVAYAAPIPDFGSGVDGSAGATATATGAPKLKDIVAPIVRVVNTLLAAGGIIFVILLFWSGYKYSLAQGDPKAVVMAKESLTHAIQGFLVVVGAFTLVTVVGGLFGIDSSFSGSVGQDSENAIQELVNFFDAAQ